MSERSEARAERRRRHQEKQERRVKPTNRAAVRFDAWRSLVAGLPAGLANTEINRMVDLINNRINEMEGGDGR